MAGPIKAQVLLVAGTDYQSVQHELIVCATMANFALLFQF